MYSIHFVYYLELIFIWIHVTLERVLLMNIFQLYSLLIAALRIEKERVFGGERSKFHKFGILIIELDF